MKNILKIFTALLFALNMMPVSAATQQDMQKDIDSLTRAFDEHIAKLKNVKQETKKNENESKKIENENECKERGGTFKSGSCWCKSNIMNNPDSKCIDGKIEKNNTKTTEKTEKTKTEKQKKEPKEKNNEPKPAKAGDNCDSTDPNAKTARYEKTGQGTTLNCVIKKCNKGFEVSPDGQSCTTKLKVGDVCDHEDENAKSAKIEKNNRGELTCVIKTCSDGYNVSSNGQSCIKKTNVSKDCTAQIPNAKDAKINENGDCKVYSCNTGFIVSFNDLWCIKDTSAGTDCHSEVEHATVAKYDSNRKCIVEECEDGYTVSSNRRSCVEISAEQPQNSDKSETSTTTGSQKSNRNSKKTYRYLDPNTIETTDYRVAYGEVYLLNSEKPVSFMPNMDNYDSTMECPELYPGEWCALYNTPGEETVLQGDYQCDNSQTSRTNIPGPHCWCGATEPTGYWEYFGSYRDANDCDKNCGQQQCIQKAADTRAGLRRILTSNNSSTVNQYVSPDKETKITTPTNNNTKPSTDYKNTQESTSTHSKPKTEKGSVSPRDDGLYYTDDFGILDANEVNIYQDGIFARAKTNVGSCSKNVQSDKKFAEYNSAGGCDNISPRIWEAYFDNGKVVGTYKCTNKLPSKNAVTYTGRTGNGYKESFRIDTPGDTPGNYCWCAATEPNSLHWVYVRLENDAYGKPQDCENSSSCVGRCASAFQKSATFRKAMFKDEP